MSNQLKVGDRIIVGRAIGFLEEGDEGIVLDIDSKGNITLKMYGENNIALERFVLLTNEGDFFVLKSDD